MDNYNKARWERILQIARTTGNVFDVADKFGVHPSYVSKARRAVSVWGHYPEDDLIGLSLERLYAGALLAQKVGHKKAFELMKTRDSKTLYALAKGNFVRKSLPTVDEGIYIAVIDQYKRFADAYREVVGSELSFDRFLETVLAIVREIDDDALAGIIEYLWGDIYG